VNEYEWRNRSHKLLGKMITLLNLSFFSGKMKTGMIPAIYDHVKDERNPTNRARDSGIPAGTP
jgi:hypothetical protein